MVCVCWFVNSFFVVGWLFRLVRFLRSHSLYLALVILLCFVVDVGKCMNKCMLNIKCNHKTIRKSKKTCLLTIYTTTKNLEFKIFFVILVLLYSLMFLFVFMVCCVFFALFNLFSFEFFVFLVYILYHIFLVNIKNNINICRCVNVTYILFVLCKFYIFLVFVVIILSMFFNW